MSKKLFVTITKGSSQLGIKKTSKKLEAQLFEVQNYGVKVVISGIEFPLWMVGNRKYIPSFKVGSAFHVNNGNPCKRITLEVQDWE